LRAHEAGQQARQHYLGVLPPNVVQQLECLVREIEGVALVQEEVVGAGSEDHVGDRLLGQADADCRP
jgi:hypothetical protein